MLLFRVGDWAAAGAPAQAPVAGVLQRAVGKSYAAPVAAQPERHEPQERSLAAGRSLANLLRVRRQARHLNLPSAQWRLARYRHLPHPDFRDFLRRRDKPLI